MYIYGIYIYIYIILIYIYILSSWELTYPYISPTLLKMISFSLEGIFFSGNQSSDITEAQALETYLRSK